MTESRAMFHDRWGRLMCLGGTAGVLKTIRCCGGLRLARQWVIVALNLALPALAAVCPSVGNPVLGAEPQMVIDAACEDPGFNERNFVIDKVTQATLTVKATGQQIPYTQVDGHFNPTQTQATLP